jgi:hypothetical protein
MDSRIKLNGFLQNKPYGAPIFAAKHHVKKYRMIPYFRILFGALVVKRNPAEAKS